MKTKYLGFGENKMDDLLTKLDIYIQNNVPYDAEMYLN